MKKPYGTLLFAVMSLGLVACNDTAEGMAEDTKENTEVVAEATKEATDKMAESAEKMAEDVGEVTKDVAASTLTTRIKSALIANPITNDPDAKINVESDKDVVALNGTVGSEKQKSEAAEIAKEVLKEVGATQKLENNLEVK